MVGRGREVAVGRHRKCYEFLGETANYANLIQKKQKCFNDFKKL